MNTTIRESIVHLTELVILTGLILHILPGEQYQKYIKLLIGIVMIAFILDTGGHLTELYENTNYKITDTYNEKLNFERNSFQEIEESQYLCALSTYENNIKERLNKIEYPGENRVKGVKIGICEDVNNVDYGKIQSIKVELSKNVDKSVNILVSNIIIGNKLEKSENSENREIRKAIADELELDEGMVQVVIDGENTGDW